MVMLPFRIVFAIVLVFVQFTGVDCADCVDKNPAKCANLKDMCFDPGMEDLLKGECPLTCEYCTPEPTKAGGVVTTKAPTATTKPAAATTQKPTAGPNPAVTTTVKLGVTTASSCKDDPNTDCSKYVSLCSKSDYKDLLESFCPKTCNFCGSIFCEDKDHRCEAWAGNGYCTNPFYRPEDRVVCQKTCGMC